MAVHPYRLVAMRFTFAWLEEEIALRDGRKVRVRPIRPDDAVLLQRLFHGLSERSRFQRFMQHVRELSAPMLARFTQIDYRRELALLALHGDERLPEPVRRLGGRPDRQTALPAGHGQEPARLHRHT